jgi:hypothetical protein
MANGLVDLLLIQKGMEEMRDARQHDEESRMRIW